MGRASQAFLGMIALQTYDARMATGVSMDALKLLRNEIRDGSCMGVLGQDGHANRIVQTVVMKVENFDGRIWVQLGDTFLNFRRLTSVRLCLMSSASALVDFDVLSQF